MLLLPGIVAFTAFVTPLQSVATDLGRDLGFTGEIDDRLLAPLPTYLVAVEKILLATLRMLFAAALVALVFGIQPGRSRMRTLPLVRRISARACLSPSAMSDGLA